MCVSQQGNITSLFYPDTNASHQQISFDAYCLSSNPANGGAYTDSADFGGAAGAPASFGFGPATISQPNGPNQNPITVTRNTSDGKFQLSEYIAVNFVPRSIAVIVSIKNLTSVPLNFIYFRALAPRSTATRATTSTTSSGSVTSTTGPRVWRSTGLPAPAPSSWRSPRSPAQAPNPRVFTDPLADWLAGASTNFPCFGGSTPDAAGYASGGNRVFVSAANVSAALAPGATAKVTYDIRML